MEMKISKKKESLLLQRAYLSLGYRYSDINTIADLDLAESEANNLIVENQGLISECTYWIDESKKGIEEIGNFKKKDSIQNDVLSQIQLFESDLKESILGLNESVNHCSSLIQKNKALLNKLDEVRNEYEKEILRELNPKLTIR